MEAVNPLEYSSSALIHIVCSYSVRINLSSFVVQKGLKMFGAVGAAVSAVVIYRIIFHLPVRNASQVGIPLYFMETRILVAPKVAVAGIVKNLKQDLWLKLLRPNLFHRTPF
jgi:hypothetical protein